MKLSEAMEIIEYENAPGFRVHFEHVRGKFLESDYFPDRHEPCIATENEAWIFARRFANKTYGRCVNIYVCHGDCTPVDGYKDKAFPNREPYQRPPFKVQP